MAAPEVFDAGARARADEAGLAAVVTLRRIDRGRGHVYVDDQGDRYDGVTWAISNGVPKPALIDWAARTTASYAVDNWDELSERSVSERLDVLKRARWNQTRDAAVRGTQVHDLALRLAAGGMVDVPDPLVGHVDAYLKFVDEWQPQERLVETVVGHHRHRYGGTLDLVAKLADGNVWLLDWKTSASGIWPENGLQLAAYRFAQFYVDGKADERPMPEVDRVGCVWLRADGYDLIPVEAGLETFRRFLYAQQVARFVQQPREMTVGDALAPPFPDTTKGIAIP